MGGNVTTDQTTTLVFTQDDEMWIIDPGVSVKVNTDHGVFSDWANSKLINKGLVFTSGVPFVAVVFTGDGGIIKNSGGIVSANSYAIYIDSGNDYTTVVKNFKGAIVESPTNTTTLVGESGSEIIVNAGRIGSLEASLTINVAVQLGGGNDHFTNFMKVRDKVVAGKVTGLIDLGSGDDTFLGGKTNEAVQDGQGADIYKLGGGNDYFIAKGGGPTDGNDIVSGGSGIDTYSVGGSIFNPVFINLSSEAHTYNAVSIAANTAQGIDISGGLVNRDKLTGFENVDGSEASDIIFGNEVANELIGGSGADVLFGLAGNDTLNGGPGSDMLVGGKGADKIFSYSAYVNDGSGDHFLYQTLKDSTPAKMGRDVVVAMGDGRDMIDVSPIDANKNNGPATNDVFQFLGVDVPFNKAPGGLRVITKDFGWLVQADVNGDKKADFAIEVGDPGHAIVWSADDFVV